jgi:hypothetical protein
LEQLLESQAAIGMPEEASSRWLLTGFSEFVRDFKEAYRNFNSWKTISSQTQSIGLIRTLTKIFISRHYLSRVQLKLSATASCIKQG